MSWREVLQSRPTLESATQYSQKTQNSGYACASEDSEDCEVGKSVSFDNRAGRERGVVLVDLCRAQVRRAATWRELELAVKTAQSAYDASDINGKDLDAIVGCAIKRSREVPEEAVVLEQLEVADTQATMRCTHG